MHCSTFMYLKCPMSTCIKLLSQGHPKIIQMPQSLHNVLKRFHNLCVMHDFYSMFLIFNAYSVLIQVLKVTII